MRWCCALAAAACVFLVAAACGGSSSSPTPTPVGAARPGAASTAVLQIPSSATAQPVASPAVAAATAAATGTTVINYVPPAIDTALAKDGTCWIESIATGGRQGSYRCTEVNIIHDPCFSQPGLGAYVLCPGDPTTPADDLVLTADLAAVTFTSTSPHAWFFVTADGLHCSAFGGTRAPTALGWADYGCRNADGSPGTVCLEPVQQGSGWTVTCIDEGASTGTAHDIRTIWF